MKEIIDFRNNKELIKFLSNPQDCSYSINEKGLVIQSEADSRDPFVFFDLCTVIGDKSYFKQASDMPAVTVKIRTNHPGYLEIYYITDKVPEPTGYCNAGDRYEGGDQQETLLLKFEGRLNYEGMLHDGFRIDWTNYCRKEDYFIIESITLFSDLEEASECAKTENVGRRKFKACVAPEPEADGPLDEAGFYVCLRENRLKTDKEKNILQRFDNIDDAIALCNENKVYGYRVSDEKGNVVYTPYTLLQCDILREGKYVTDYVRENGFLYGDAPLNPGMDCDAKRVSCDRLVCWALYRVGFVDQPYSQGVVVSVFPAWCEENNFTRIYDYEALEPGDVMLVRPHSSGYPQHAFLFAGYCEKPEKDPGFPAHVADPGAPAGPELPEMYSYRYDCGSDARIQNVQPSRERLFPGAYIPVCVYRPRATKDNCINYNRYKD